jgi:hypothetical protein
MSDESDTDEKRAVDAIKSEWAEARAEFKEAHAQEHKNRLEIVEVAASVVSQMEDEVEERKAEMERHALQRMTRIDALKNELEVATASDDTQRMLALMDEIASAEE